MVSGLTTTVHTITLDPNFATNGKLTYTSNSASGAISDSITFWVQDDHGGQSQNAFINITFSAGTTTPQITATNPTNNQGNVDVTASITATFNEQMNSQSIAVIVTGPNGSVQGTTTYDSGTMTVTFTPSSSLSSATQYTVNVHGIDLAGNSLLPQSNINPWSFTTK
jgi:methionine-rich copper-binding protein CopC